MAEVYFISETKVKQDSFISDAVDAKIIDRTIIEVQDIYLKPLIGSALYDDIAARIEAGTVASGSPNYTTLLNSYIHPVLIQYIMAEMQIVNTYKMANKGLLTKSSDNAQPASMNDLLKVAETIKNKAEYYGQRLIEYLCANEATYPVFRSETSSDSIHPKKSAYQSGIYLG